MKKILVLAITIIATIMLFPMMVCAEDIQSGQIYVGGVLINDSNKDDVFEDGTVSYDFSSKTLNLRCAEIGKDSDGLEYGIRANIDDLKIVINEDSSIDSNTYGIYNSGNITISGDEKLTLNGKNVTESMGIFATGNIVVENTRITIEGFDNGILNPGDIEEKEHSFKMIGGLVNITATYAGIWSDSVEMKDVGKVSISTKKHHGIIAEDMIDTDDNSGADGDVVLDSCELISIYSEDGSGLYSKADTTINDCGRIRISSNGNGSPIETWHGTTEISDCELVKIVSTADFGIFNQRTVSLKNSNVSIKAYSDAITCDAFKMEKTNLNAIAHYNNDDDEYEGYGIIYNDYCDLKSGTAKIAGYPAAMWAPVEDEEKSMAATYDQGHSLLAGTEYNSYTDLSPVEYKVVKTTWDSEDTDVWYWYPAVGDVKAQSLQLVASEQPDPIAELEKLVAELKDTIKDLKSQISELKKDNSALKSQLAAPGKPAIRKFVRSRSRITVYWSTAKKATSYQLYYKQKGKASKTVAVKGKSKTLKNLKRGKRYYIKVRAVKRSGNIVVYGSWSKLSSVISK